MFRMIKFVAFALFGYFLYEVIKGIAQPHERRSTPPAGGNHDEFKTVPVYETSGERRTQKVGRGVISR